MIGAWPSRPPHEMLSPTRLPITGMMRTAVVFWFTIPMAASSAIIPEIVVAGVTDRCEIWDKARWDEYNAKAEEILAETLEGLDI